MYKKATFAEQALQFYDKLSKTSLDVPDGFKIVNPFLGNQKEVVYRVSAEFYKKYYNLILLSKYLYTSIIFTW